MTSFRARVLGSYKNYVILDSTAFYPTGGGQIHDTGYIILEGGGRARVTRVEAVGDVIIHEIEGIVPDKGETITGIIDWERRYRIMRHHTVTHVLIATARKVLGRHVWQAGAEKTEEKGRLDITHHKPLTQDELRRIEEEVLKIIDRRIPVEARVEPKNEAESKYGFIIYQGGVPMKKNIRIVEVKGVDVEACYGTHVKNTGEIGSFKIIKYDRIQDGVIRLEYVAGTRTSEEAQKLEDKLDQISQLVKASRGMEVERVKSLLEDYRRLELTLKKYRREWIKNIEELIKTEDVYKGVKILVIKAVEDDRKANQELLKKLTTTYNNLIAILLVDINGGVQAEIAIGREASKQIDAGKIAEALIKEFGGKGGGRGTRASVRLKEYDTTRIHELVKELLG